MATLKSSLEPNKRDFPGGFEDVTLSLCHINKKEAKTWDAMQEGAEFGQGENIPIRSYEKLGEKVKDKNFRDLYLSVVEEQRIAQGGVAHELEQDYQIGKEVIESTPWQDAPGDAIPEVQELASQGVGKGAGKDTIMAYLPNNFMYLLAIERGSIELNAKTGFPQCGFFNEFVRVGATVVGAVVGGPVGAAAGSAVGSALTGRKTQHWLPQAAKAGALAYGAGLASNAFGYPNMLGTAANIGSTLGLGGAAAAAPAAAGAAGTAGAATAAGTAAAGAGAAAPGFFGNILSSPYLGPGLMMGALALSPFAAKKEHKMSKQEEEEAYRLTKRREEEELQKSGFYNRDREPQMRKVYNSKFGQGEGEPNYVWKHKDELGYAPGGDVDFKGELIPQGNGEYLSQNEGDQPMEGDLPLKDGILIEGVGKGQDDLIHTEVPEGTYIVPADVAAMLGDGSSDAAIDVLKEAYNDMAARMDPQELARITEESEHHKMVPVALSRGEIPIWPSYVTMFGNGQHSEGVKRLNNLRTNIRLHKTQNGGKLPPKAKPLFEYTKG